MGDVEFMIGLAFFAGFVFGVLAGAEARKQLRAENEQLRRELGHE